jgi:carboxyvinyl-carboxyphosphonate phosphorylmutase
MKSTDRRLRMRAVLAGQDCLSPADVFDPLSARIAESVGYQLGVLTGAMSSASTLAAPDLVLLTLTDFSDQVRRITRASGLSLLVDADHGYGNALNVMRTVIELEHAGVAALTIEDTQLPRRFGQTLGTLELITVAEMTGKLRAALAARCDAELVIAARTSLRIDNFDETVARARAYAATGVDALFVVGLEKIEQLKAIRAAVELPLMLGPVNAPIERDLLAADGARIMLHGHEPARAAIKAMQETYAHLFRGGEPQALKSRIASSADMERLINAEAYKELQQRYLR